MRQMKPHKSIELDFTSHPTINRSFWRRSSQSISWQSQQK